MYQNILLPIDGSENSLHAVDQAIELMKNQKPAPKLTVLHVLPPSYYFAEAGLAAASLNIDLDKEAQKSATNLLQLVSNKLQATGIDHELKLEKGAPAQIICKYVADNEYDLVVMGSRGLGGFSEFVLGSVSHKVLTHVKKPVLVVR